MALNSSISLKQLTVRLVVTAYLYIKYTQLFNARKCFDNIAKFSFYLRRFSFRSSSHIQYIQIIRQVNGERNEQPAWSKQRAQSS